MTPAEPCHCWRQSEAVLHDGHCCFREWDNVPGPMPCHHDIPERVALLRAITRKANA